MSFTSHTRFKHRACKLHQAEPKINAQVGASQERQKHVSFVSDVDERRAPEHNLRATTPKGERP
jgi:hypothetical protein